MKKSFTLLMCGVALALSSCTKDVAETSSLGQEATASFTIDGIASASTRATFANPDMTGMRLVVMVSHDDVVVTSQTVSNWDGLSETVNFRLVTGQTYSVAAWADFGDTYYTVTGDEESEYGSAPAIALADYTIASSLNTNDAYFAINNSLVFNATGDTETLTLSRPFGLIKVTTTDAGEDAVENAGYNPTSYNTTINVPTTFSLLTGDAGDSQDVTFTNDVAQTHVDGETTQELSFDYIFASDTGELLTYDVEYFANTTSVMTYSYSNIPVQRNYVTNVSGNILTMVGSVDASVDQSWGGDIDATMPDTVVITEFSTLYSSIETLDQNGATEVAIEIADNTSLGSNVFSIPATTNVEVITIDLSNGTTNSSGNIIFRDGTNPSTYSGKLIISTPSTKAGLVLINAPYADVYFSGSANTINITCKDLEIAAGSSFNSESFTYSGSFTDNR